MVSVDVATQDAWRGLWHPAADRGWSSQVLLRLGIYAGIPLMLALLLGEAHGLRSFATAYAGAFLVTAAICGGFEICYHAVWRRIVRRELGLPARIAGHAVTVLVAVGAGAVVAARLGERILGWRDALFRLWLQGMVISFLVIAVLVILDEMTARARALERREVAHRVAVLRAELSALQARTDPHFLFNALNTVAALIPGDPTLAEALVERLAMVFRYALDAGRRDMVALADEIEAVTAYLEVEALRMGDRLHWRFDRDPDLQAIRVPPLVLQPLVENAIRHGAGGRQGTTEIAVSVRMRGDELVLAVEDHGVDGAVAHPAGGGTGTALADLRARLALIYADRARLATGAVPSGGWRAELVLPVVGR